MSYHVGIARQFLAKKVDFKPKKNLKVRQRRHSFLPELHPFKNNKLFVHLTAGASARVGGNIYNEILKSEITCGSMAEWSRAQLTLNGIY